MILNGLRKRAENHTGFSELFLERCCNGYAVEHGIHGDAREARALVQRYTELVVGFEQLGIDFVKALGAILVGLRRGVIGNRVEIDFRIIKMGPLGLLHVEPLAVGAQAPLEHELRLVLACGDSPNDVFVEAWRQALGFDIGYETVFVAPVDETLEMFGFGGHQFFFSTVIGVPAKLNFGGVLLARNRSARLTSSSALRIATLMRCQAPPTLQTCS